MAGGTEMISLTGEGREIFMVAIPAFHQGRAVVQVAIFQVTGNEFLTLGSPEPLPPFEPLLVDLGKGFQMVFHALVIIGRLGIPGAVNGGRSNHNSSPPRNIFLHFYSSFDEISSGFFNGRERVVISRNPW
jgi:hypothetical protein